ncbi:MAG TPA: hypothetical protein VGR08_01040 [Thermomicrobiales bacterium]|nr:hypothetical protein [Thermomicrobiales bacterium]
MMQPLLLDALLILIIIMLIPIGVHRGGLREACTAGGLLLGMHLVDQWATTWGNSLSNVVGIVPSVTTFIVAILVLLLTTGFVGYGATAAFASSPRAGGRMYGAILAFLVGAVFLGSVIDYVGRFLYEGETPDIIRQGYISRLLSVGIGWVLLFAALVVVLATLFGMVVRERDADEIVMPIARAPVTAPSARLPESALASDAEKLEPPPPEPRKVAADEVQRTAPIRIREVRHWDEPQDHDTRAPGPSWNQTWPQAGRGPVQRTRRPEHTRRQVRRSPLPNTSHQESQTDDDDTTVLRDWLAEGGQGGEPNDHGSGKHRNERH